MGITQVHSTNVVRYRNVETTVGSCLEALFSFFLYFRAKCIVLYEKKNTIIFFEEGRTDMSKEEKKGNKKLVALTVIMGVLFLTGLTTLGLLVLSYTMLAL